MTDEQIIKALKECLTEPCSEQAYINAVRNALDLINRQQAEIKALNTENKQLQSDVITANQYYEHTKEQLEKAIKISQRSNQRFKEAKKELQNAKSEVERLERHTEMYHEVRAEAVKEFAERLKEKAHRCDLSTDEHEYYSVGVFEIDNLVKEMVGDN